MRRAAQGAIIQPEVTAGIAAFVAGCPAVPVRSRFDRRTADHLLALAWCDWDQARSCAAPKDFRALKAKTFLDRFDG